MDLAKAYRFLESTQNPDGGWGCRLHGRSMVESTGAVLLAAVDHWGGPTLALARRWLERAQHADGGWGLGPEDPQSHWCTAWAILALTRLDPQAPAIAQGVRWLLQVPAIRIQSDELTEEVRRTLGIDPSLSGTP
ncbi:MAG TPA: prenyltransferase/squalene oxidase repeat-containing protein [Thermoflexus sp.]|nr:prenyltransferase/squalene oxidase repeat-containing protein [Thermoflexus sp.]